MSKQIHILILIIAMTLIFGAFLLLSNKPISQTQENKSNQNDSPIKPVLPKEGGGMGGGMGGNPNLHP